MYNKYNINDYVIKLDKLGKIIIYLRKSREDLIDGRYLSDEETLARHEEQLQQWAETNLGYRIPENCIFKEVESGEKIKNRPVFQQVLREIESPEVGGVLVLNCSRLSRGDLSDCGAIIKTFELTNTAVLTPPKIYNLKDKYDKRFFKDELLRGNDYLEMTKELLSNGRHWSTAMGKFVGSAAPYGYDRVTCAEMKLSDEKGFTLRQNDRAQYVKTMFEMILEGHGAYKIASHLKAVGAPTIGDDPWDHCQVKKILKNSTYAGILTWGERAKQETMINGEVIEKRVYNPDCPKYKGLHTPIIDEETFFRVQEKMKGTAPVKSGDTLKNPLAGLLKCGVCGKAIIRHINSVKTVKRTYELDKKALQKFLRKSKKAAKLSNGVIAEKLGIKAHHVNDWLCPDPARFHTTGTFVENWFKLKEVLQIETDEYDAAITTFSEVKKAPSFACSGHRCENGSSYMHIVEERLKRALQEKFEHYNYFLDNYAEEITKKIENDRLTVEQIDKKISSVKAQIKKAKIAYEKEVDTLEEYIERKTELQKTISELEEQKEGIQETGEEEKTVTIKKAVPIISAVFESYDTLEPQEKNELLKTVIESIMYIKNEDGEPELDICWIV